MDTTNGGIPLDDFIASIRSALGADIPPDLDDLLARLRFASGPDLPLLLAQIVLRVSSSDGDVAFRDYERY